jgi:hypothetical protein
LQSELRSSGHVDFADSILEIEIEHYRELIVWQLQLRAYLTQKLNEYGGNPNLSTLKDLLAAEYAELKKNSLFQSNFENAIEVLRDIDDKVRATSSMDTTEGILVLPWIDRDAIDHKQGIESEVLSIEPGIITWKTAIESIDDETKVEMKNSYGRAIYYIRALAVVSEKLYLESDLETMVQLHSKLANNKNVNYTPTGISYQNFGTIKGTYRDGGIFPELDVQRDEPSNSFLKMLDSDINDDKTKDTSGGGEKSYSQIELDMRRFDIIASDFWGHQARRKNGDLTVGEIILPWVEVPDK